MYMSKRLILVQTVVGNVERPCQRFRYYERKICIKSRQPTKVPRIKDLGYNEPLCHNDDVIHRHLVGVESHAVTVHGKGKADDHQVPDQAEDDGVVVPPQPLTLEASTQQAHPDRNHGEHID